MKRWFLFVLLIALCLHGFSQTDTLAAQKDSVFVPDTSQFKTKFRKTFSLRWHTYPHSPLKATLFSAVIPGTGQMYNGYKKDGSFFRKYWKVPVVYAGIGTCVGFIIFNTNQYNFYKKEFISLADTDPNTNPTIQGTVKNFNDNQEQYHKWMDVSYIALMGVYVFQIIDANVDAHLFYYDVGNDLSLQLHPSVVSTGMGYRAGIGLTFGF